MRCMTPRHHYIDVKHVRPQCASRTLLQDGFTYERTAIVGWFQRSGNSPMTNEPLEHKGLVPNRALKNLIAATALLEQQRLS